MSPKIIAWLKKRKWDVLFYTFIALVVFVPQVRMPVVSTIQRILAFSPKELPAEQQVSIRSYDWELVDMEGKAANFAASEGKVVVLNIWATWCPPCVAEMPSFQKLYDKYKNDVAFYFVSNEQPQPILNFIERKGYTFPIYIATSMPPKEFDAAKLPTTYVLNKQGKIVMEEVGAHDWFSSSFQEKLEVMLGE